MARTASPGPRSTRPSTPRTHPRSRPAPHRTPTASSRSPARPTSSITCRDPERASPRALHQQPHAPTHGPRTASRGTDRNASGNGHRPTCTPDRSGSSGSHNTENASIGSGIPFSSSSPTDSNRRALDPAREQLGRQGHEDPVRRPIGPRSPIRSDGAPRSRLAGGQSERSGAGTPGVEHRDPRRRGSRRAGAGWRAGSPAAATRRCRAPPRSRPARGSRAACR